MQAATHSGKFHADDVLAWALLSQFIQEDITLIRTRDPQLLNRADIVFDVGGIYDPSQKLFDHHQNTYQGTLSSAGMVLQWLFEQNLMSTRIHKSLQEQIVHYVDDVDNGIREPSKGVPCFASMVENLNHGAQTLQDFDVQFEVAANLARVFVKGIVTREEELMEAEEVILKAMNDALETESNLIELPRYLPWQPIYFANGGLNHPTEYLLFPTISNTWQVLAIPPEEDSFAQKRPFPEKWAGLRDKELSDVTGEAAIFCHKNRFIAVFHSKSAAINAMRKFNLLS